MESLSMYQVILVGSSIICLIIGPIAILFGMPLFYYLKKPFGQKVFKLGFILATLGIFLFFIAVKKYLSVIIGLLIIYVVRKKYKSGIK